MKQYQFLSSVMIIWTIFLRNIINKFQLSSNKFALKIKSSEIIYCRQWQHQNNICILKTRKKRTEQNRKNPQERTIQMYVTIHVAFIWYKHANNKISGIMGDCKWREVELMKTALQPQNWSPAPLDCYHCRIMLLLSFWSKWLDPMTLLIKIFYEIQICGSASK